MVDSPFPQVALIRDGALYGATPDTTAVQRRDLPIAGRFIASPPSDASPPGDGLELRATNLSVLPGFIDLHVHGGQGFDTMDGDPQALRGMGAFHARHGTTGFMPTTTTAAKDRILRAVRAAAECITQPMAGARLLGVHVEGPFISDRFPGAQNPRHICGPDPDFLAALCEPRVVKLMTVAPEIPDGLALVRELTAQGIVPVMGHTASTYAEAAAGSRAGVTQATHTFNAMQGLHHRAPGALGWVMQDPTIFAQLIADNIHVHPGAMKVLALCKSYSRILLITDAIRAAGLSEGVYDLGSLSVTVRDGACRLADGTLAGSLLTMETALANFMAATGAELRDAWPASSLTAAQSCGLDDRLGRLMAGYWADIVLLDDDLQVIATVVDGRLAHLHPEHRHRVRERHPAADG